MSSIRPIGISTDPVHSLVSVTRRDDRWFWLAINIAVSVHLGLGWLVSHRFVSKPKLENVITTELIDIELSAPKDAKEKVEPEPEAKPEPKERRRTPRIAKKTLPPRPAQAGAILTRKEEADEPVDLTDFVVGTATSYAGGTTMSSGTNASAVQGPADISAGNGQVGDTIIHEPKADRSRPPSIIGDTNWNCQFPREADLNRIRQAVAIIRVTVNAQNQLVKVDVLKDPLFGFGEAARHCAMRKSWRSARNRNGVSIAGTVTVRVHFIR